MNVPRLAKNKITLFIAAFLLIGLPLVVTLLSRNQDTRNRATATSRMYFLPASSSTAPITVTENNTFTVQLMVDPGQNLVSFVRYEVNFDSSRLSVTPGDIQVNTQAFPTTLESPAVLDGKVGGAISIGNDPTRAHSTITEVARITFTATAPTTSPILLQYGVNTLVLSVAATDQANENVLLTVQPAYIRIAPAPTPLPTLTPTPMPPTLYFNADTTNITVGDTVNLNWSSQDANSCSASGNYTGWTGNKALQGSQIIGPFATAGTYTLTLTCTNGGGNASDSITITVQPAPLPTLGDTVLDYTLFLHGIGNSGDNRNPEHSLSNKNPLTQNRNIRLEIFNGSDQLVRSLSGIMDYNATNGNFTGSINLGSTLPAGQYILKIKTEKYLRNVFLPQIQTITAGRTNTLPNITLIAGDINGDNKLDILDYNLLINCYSTPFSPVPIYCDETRKFQADINDDGNVNQYDFNLFLRELSVQAGV